MRLKKSTDIISMIVVKIWKYFTVYFQHLTLYYIIKLCKCLQNAGMPFQCAKILKKNSGSILVWSASTSFFGIDWRPWPTSQTFSFLCCRQFSNQFAAHLSLYFVGLGTVSPRNLGLNFNVWNRHCEAILYHWFLFSTLISKTGAPVHPVDKPSFIAFD